MWVCTEETERSRNSGVLCTHWAQHPIAPSVGAHRRVSSCAPRCFLAGPPAIIQRLAPGAHERGNKTAAAAHLRCKAAYAILAVPWSQKGPI